MDKKAFYQREDIVSDYEDWRFGSAGGRYVDEVERSNMLALLQGVSRTGKILDMPCGTGRLLTCLREAGFTDVLGADSSEAMLARAAKNSQPVTLADAFATPFESQRFDVVCSLRFLFHVDAPSRLFSEVSRILKPGGHFVFDSLNWTPRGIVPGLNRALGGELFCYRQSPLSSYLRQAGLSLVQSHAQFVLPSMAYRFVPELLVPALKQLERTAPRRIMSKVFYLAQKSDT